MLLLRTVMANRIDSDDDFSAGVGKAREKVNSSYETYQSGARQEDGEKDFFLFSTREESKILDFVFDIKDSVDGSIEHLIEMDIVDGALQGRHFFQCSGGMAQVKRSVFIDIGIVGISDKIVPAGAFNLNYSLVDWKPQSGPAGRTCFY